MGAKDFRFGTAGGIERSFSDRVLLIFFLDEIMDSSTGDGEFEDEDVKEIEFEKRVTDRFLCGAGG